MTYFLKGRATGYNFGPINLRCPACRQNGSFSQIAQIDDIGWHNQIPGSQKAEQYKAGMRTCPNVACQALVFFVEGPDFRRITLPPEVIDFDATNLPAGILASLEEAIQCHANGCYRASALMVRRTLEELCDDKAANGANLKARIAALSSVAVIPAELLTAADELRILGNDAAHVEAKAYDKIGNDESELAIELAKELLKAVYQYSSLLARLTALKKSNTALEQAG